MMPFHPTDRSIVLDRIIAIARADSRVTGGAIVGSGAADSFDVWSDIDISFGLRSGVDLGLVLDEWTELLQKEFGMAHHFDVPSGTAIYRVLLLPNCLEMDLSVVPESDFGARSPRFKLLFGNAVERSSFPRPDAEGLIGWGWHHILHANAAIGRGRYWQAEFWISGARDYLLALRTLRFGEESAHARSVHLLPKEATDDLEGMLVRSIHPQELRRALRIVAEVLIEEIRAQNDSDLADRLGRMFKAVLET